MIALEALSYSYPDASAPVLHNVNWHAEEGGFVLVAGCSGSGKSTLLRCLNGLVPHFHGGRIGGRIRVGGRDPVSVGPAGMSSIVGFVFQDPESQAVLPVVEEEIAFGLENHGLDWSTMRRRVEEMLDLLDIAHLRRREISSLSGGERQRVALASVLALYPPCLVLDEPTSQLDPQAAEDVLTALERLNSDHGTTVVLAEHRLERVISHANRLLYLPGPGRPPLDRPMREGLDIAPLVPPLIEVGRALDWNPLPLTIRDGRRYASRHRPPPLAPQRPSVRTAGSPLALAVEGLDFAYGRQRILRDINLRIEPGELVALMGRNGAGKSTLLRLIMGLLRPRRGSIRVAGQDTRRLSTAEIAHLAGYVPQQPGQLLFAESVQAELEFTRRHHPQAGASEPLLAELGLAGVTECYPRDLATGEQQRVALAAILVAQPQLLLLDEPTRGLDYAAKQRLMQLLAARRASGTSILMATHDVELVARSADRVVLLGDGEIVADGPPRTVLAGSYAFAPQVNRLFGGQYLTPAEVLGALRQEAESHASQA